VSRIESWTEIHLLSAKFKEPSLLTLNFGGENHEKGFPENAGKKPLRVFYMPSEAFFVEAKAERMSMSCPPQFRWKKGGYYGCKNFDQTQI
jgi:hypothetical protein